MNNLFHSLKNDWSISATVAGFLAVLISYSGRLIIFFQAAQQAQVSPDMLISWNWGISIGAALAGVFLSIKYRMPLRTGRSAPGAALVVTPLPEISLNEAVAAYITSGVVILVIGITGYLHKMLSWMPREVAAGMMSGNLLQFGRSLFTATDT